MSHDPALCDDEVTVAGGLLDDAAVDAHFAAHPLDRETGLDLSDRAHAPAGAAVERRRMAGDVRREAGLDRGASPDDAVVAVELRVVGVERAEGGRV